MCVYESKMEAVNRAEDASYLHIDLLAFRLNTFFGNIYDVVAVAVVIAVISSAIAEADAILFEWLRASHFIGGGFSCLVCACVCVCVCRISVPLSALKFPLAIKTIIISKALTNDLYL